MLALTWLAAAAADACRWYGVPVLLPHGWDSPWNPSAWVLASAFALGLLAALSAGRRLIAYLTARALRQHAYEDAPQTHAVKTGTPTMGGLLFLLGILVAWVPYRDLSTYALTIVALACAAIGFADDLLSIRRGRNRGMRARTKLGATALAALLFLVPAWCVLWHSRALGTMPAPEAWIWPLSSVAVPLWAWSILGLVTVLATTHAVNLTDGLDGLASGVAIPPLLVLAAIAWSRHLAGVAVVDLATAGALVGFLYYNRHPAKLFMGDTGSLALGGILAGSAILTGTQILLIVIGGVFVAETLSVILQVTSYKLTRKRIFRMSPLHHHFELGGWPETKVTRRFWTASVLASLAGAALYRWAA